jgi:lipopolysaccharide/colanic/teichoic acid biosynthesis glycosyltransferase
MRPSGSREAFYSAYGKRLLDVCISVLVLAVSLPLIAAIAVCIYFELGPPVIFRQERAGFGGRPFTIYKFRTLRDEYAHDGTPLPDDMRMIGMGTVLRNLSLDELPQLWNVLKGDLSLIGPRPLLMEYLPLYTEEERTRHDVRPGISGWAQVNGRNAISWEDRFQLDRWYVTHVSFKLDLRILYLTLVRVLGRDGISQAGMATMTKFSR